MGIVFGRDGTLYATNYGGESSLYRIDPASGQGEKIASFPERDVHSADIKPTEQQSAGRPRMRGSLHGS
jgi:outer membrane protein assembly factor BamB